ncbi:MAG: carbohydrate ABC transporter permease [Clostridiales bacterium]|nr:carbohydrate ABC transporter permease [Clostridiales bacterium]
MKKSFNKGILSDSDMKKPSGKLIYGIIIALLVVMSIIVVVPVLWLLLAGFKDVQELYEIPAKFFPKKIELAKLWRVWNEMKFYRFYINTFIMAGGAVAATVVVDGLAGYTLSRLRPAGSRIIMTLLFALMLMPGTMRTVPLYMTFKSFSIFKISLLDSFIPIWIMAAADIFSIIMFKNFFDGISDSLVEAATIDGAGNMKIFFKIIVPLSVPIIMTVAIFSFNGQMGQFFWPYLLIGDQSKTVLGVQLYKMKGGNYTQDYHMLAILFSIVPQVVVFLVFQRFIIGGVNVGGVKG